MVKGYLTEYLVFGIFGLIISLFQFRRWYMLDKDKDLWLAIFTVIISITLICWGWPI